MPNQPHLSLVTEHHDNAWWSKWANRTLQVETVLRDLPPDLQSAILRQAAVNLGLADAGRGGA